MLFQIEVFESVPGIGAISGGFLNEATLLRVDRTARHIFQERRLRESGKAVIRERYRWDTVLAALEPALWQIAR